MSRARSSRPLLGLVAAVGLAAGAAVAVPVTATAAPASHLVIDEAYLNGGSSGASYANKFVEVKNPTDQPVDVSGWSIQYRSATSTSAFSGITPLGDHVIPAGRSLLVSGGTNGASTNPGATLPTPDVTGSTQFSGSAGGTIVLARTTTALTGDRAAVVASPSYVDLLGYGTSTTSEGTAKASGWGLTSSLVRTGGTDTDDNNADFSSATPTPVACGADCSAGTEPPGEVESKTIAQIQGTGTASPLENTAVKTTGVVTATYPEGGFDGAYIQTEGTGGDLDLTQHTASDGVFVYSKAFAADVQVGDHVEVTGTVKEFNGLTELATSAGGWTVLTTPAEAVKPADVAWPLTETQRESLEGMLVAPQGDYTITNNYSTNQYGEIGLAAGTSPLHQPTDVVRPGTSAYTALVAENARRLITLDDGSSVNFVTSNKDVALPWLTATNEVRQGARATFTAPVVLDYRFGWKLQPTARLIGTTGAPATFSSTRTAKPEPVGGQVTLGSFNVLNYFPTTGEKFVADGLGTCTYYKDRDGNPITNNTCTNNGPRGAATDASLARQQIKIVKAFTTLDADIVAVEELENSAALGQPRDTALNTFVAALNAHEGQDVWAGVVSPSTVPTSGSDVIRTAFVYKKAAVSPVGSSTILDSPAFQNARAPLAQTFRPVGSTHTSDFVVIANHFKSKGSGEGANADQGDGQGASNASRVAQAQALVSFAADVEQAAGTDKVFLAGDFNAYAKEDPVKVLEDAGFVNVSDALSGKDTYQFDGQIGSLDHVFASPSAARRVRGADVWQINAPESIGREYSRFNYNVTNLYDDSPYRASDHDPSIVGFDADPAASNLAVDGPASVRRGTPVELRVRASGGGEGAPAATGTVTLTEGGTTLDTANLSDGGATLDISTASSAVGPRMFTVSYSGDAEHAATTASYSLTVLKGTVDLDVSAGTRAYGTSGSVVVTAGPDADGGLVYALSDGRLLGGSVVSGGTASITLSGTGLAPGEHAIEVFYGGNQLVEPADATVSHVVTKAVSSLKAKASPTTLKVKKTSAQVAVTVSTRGFEATGGRVTVKAGTKVVGTGTVKAGRATITLRPFTSTGTRKLTVTWAGNDLATGSTGSVTVKVVR